MAPIRRFEDIEAWQEARKLTRAIYACSCKNRFGQDYGLSNQIRKAAISIMSNIAEGFGREGNREFGYFLSIARGSVTEVQSQLYIALDTGYINSDQFKNTICQSSGNRPTNKRIHTLFKRIPLKRIKAQTKTMNHEPRTTNHEPRTMNHEPRTMNHEP